MKTNEELKEEIDGMDKNEMLSLLRDIEGTRFWVAINKYNQQRLQFSQNSLITIDPFKEPTQMARQQGIMIGLSDLTNAVIELNKPKESESDDFPTA